MKNLLVLCATVLAISVFSCKKEVLSIPLRSGISVTAIGHYCPGMQPVGTPIPCGEEPLTTFALQIKNSASGAVTQVVTDNSGKSQIKLSPGEYTISIQPNLAISGGPFTIKVKAAVFTQTQLDFEELRQ